ncbi:MAG: shikimate dehydrogenase [Rickettsiales bacterium]
MTKLNQIIKAGVIGNPISHSLSPIIHNFYLEKYKINGSYDKYLIDTDNYQEQIIYLINSKKLSGFNITIPFKEKILNLCNHLSSSARNIGAANTIKIMENGKIFGHNSDAFGFLNNLFRSCPTYNFYNTTNLIIGAGGASRAVLYALINQKVKHIFIANRSHENAKKLIDDFQNLANKNNVILEYIDFKDINSIYPKLDLMVNTSSMGMKNQEPLNIDLSNINHNCIIYDIVYNPLFTNLILQAKKHNLKFVTGIGMLIYQALIGFELWFGKQPEYDQDLENLLINNLSL